MLANEPPLTTSPLATSPPCTLPWIATAPRLPPLVMRPLLLANPTKARRHLGWKPELTFERLVTLMVDEDLATLRQQAEIATRTAA